jgi:hypothetical protein
MLSGSPAFKYRALTAAGIPIRVVAVNHEVPMLERTYAKNIGEHADALTRNTLLNIGRGR